MPAGGVWWINTDREQDAISLINQTIATQDRDANLALIGMGQNLRDHIKIDNDHGPDKIQIFAMPNQEKSLYFLTRDLLCTFEPKNYLLILWCANNAWHNISAPRLQHWLEKSHAWAKYHKCTLLIINPGSNTDKQSSILMSEYRSLFGLRSGRRSRAVGTLDAV